MKDEYFNGILTEVLSNQNLGVLATTGDEYPHTSLVGFIVTEDFKSIVFATLKQTRKYTNLIKNPKVTVLIDSSKNRTDDFKDAAAVTIFGKASDVTGEDKKEIQAIYLSKFPFLEDFVTDPKCVLVRVNVDKFMIVARFQEIMEIVP